MSIARTYQVCRKHHPRVRCRLNFLLSYSNYSLLRFSNYSHTTRLSARCANIPPRVPRPWPAPPTATTPAPAASPVATVPIRSDRDRAELVGTPLLRLTPPPGDTPTAPTKLDALGDAAELQFADSVVRCSHADWEREQQAESMCYAAMRYITIGRPSSYHPTLCRATRRTSVPPFRTSANWPVEDDYTRPTTTSSYSSVTGHRR